MKNNLIEKLTKSQIRSKILWRLRKQKEEAQAQKSKLIKGKLFKTRVFKKAKIVLLFISLGGEINTQDMIKEARKSGKIVAVPVCKRNGIMRPSVLLEKARLIRGPYATYEPAIKRFVNLEDLDLVIVPGIAFDKKGNRLGRGKGYYDRFLRKLPEKTSAIGLAYDFQILPHIPANILDKKVDRVILA